MTLLDSDVEATDFCLLLSLNIPFPKENQSAHSAILSLPGVYIFASTIYVSIVYGVKMAGLVWLVLTLFAVLL